MTKIVFLLAAMVAGLHIYAADGGLSAWMWERNEVRPKFPSTYVAPKGNSESLMRNSLSFEAEEDVARRSLPDSTVAHSWKRIVDTQGETLSVATIQPTDGVTWSFAVYNQLGNLIPYYWTGEGYPRVTDGDIFAASAERAKCVLGTTAARSRIMVATNIVMKSDVEITMMDGTSVDMPFERGVFVFIDDCPGANWAHPCRYVFFNEDLTAFAVSYQLYAPRIRCVSSGERLRLKAVEEAADVVSLKEITDKVYSAANAMTSGGTLGQGDVSRSHFVLISGGADPENNAIRFWADTAMLYSTFTRKYGVPKSQIHVLMSDGGDPAEDANLNNFVDPVLVDSPTDLDGDGASDVDGAATWAAMNDVFTNTLVKTVTADSQVFVFIVSHGAANGTAGVNNHNCIAYLYSTTYSTAFNDYELAEMTQSLPCPVAFAIETCYSGGFIDDLMATPDRVVLTACDHYESSLGTGGNSRWGTAGAGSTCAYDAWAVALAAAMRECWPANYDKTKFVFDFPWNDGGSAASDANGDGLVSVEEAFVFARDNDECCCKDTSHASCHSDTLKVEHPQFAESTAGLAQRMSVWKQQEANASSDFTYDIVAGSAVITKYTGSGSRVIIPSTLDGYAVTALDDFAFNNQSTVTSITLPDSLTRMGWFSLANCRNLTTIHLPANVAQFTSRQYAPFGGNTSQATFTVAAENSHFTAVDGVLFTKDMKELISFPAGKNVERYDIPSSVTNIWGCAFDSCKYLSAVTIPEGVSSLMYCAFESSSKLTSVSLPESLRTIDYYVFQGCSSLKSLTVPAGVTSIGYNALNTSSLTKLVLLGRSGAKYAGTFDYAAEKWGATIANGNIWVMPDDYDYWTAKLGEGLSVIAVGSSTEFPYKLVNGNAIITNYTGTGGDVVFPAVIDGHPVTEIAAKAFDYGSSPYVNVTISEGIQKIGHATFRDSSQMESFSIPSTLTTLGDGNGFEFYACSKLRRVDVASGNANYKSIDGVLYNKAGTTLIYCPASKDPGGTFVVPSTVTSVMEYAFCSSKFKVITLPGSLTEIEENVFEWSSNLSMMVVPSSVSSIGSAAFEYCWALTSVTIPPSVTSIGNSAFRCTALKTVYVSTGDTQRVTSLYAFDSSVEFVETGTTTTYSITYALGGGTHGSTHPTNATYDTAFYVSAPTRAGYTFAGWTVTSGLNASTAKWGTSSNPTTTISSSSTKCVNGATGNVYFKNLTPTANGSVTLTANWTATYDADGFMIVDGVLWGYNGPGGEVAVPDTVRQIRADVFVGNRSLTSVVLPSSVNYVENNAFRGCTGLTNVVLGVQLTSWPSAFTDCPNVTSAVIPGDSFSANLSSTFPRLVYLKIAEGSRSIAYGLCRNCTMLKEADVPEGVSELSDYMFENCANLVHVELPQSVVTFGREVFGGCPKLQLKFDLVIPDGTSWIQWSAYEGLTFITSVSLPGGYLRIERSAFEGCTGITNLVFRGSVSTIGSRAFAGCTGLRELALTNAFAAVSNAEIGSEAFLGCNGLTHVTIPEGVGLIMNRAFGNCTNLVSANIQSTDCYMNGAFKGCSKFTDLSMKLPTVGRDLASRLDGIADNLLNLTILPGATELPTMSLSYCRNVRTLILPEGMDSIGTIAAVNCTSLEKVEFPNTLKIIGSNAFRGCGNLSEADLPQGLQGIAPYAFSGCKIAHPRIPNSVSDVWFKAFGDVDLANWTIAPGNPYLTVDSGVLYNVLNGSRFRVLLASRQISGRIELPASVTELQDYAFDGCEQLSEVIVPEGVARMGSEVFANCTALSAVRFLGDRPVVGPYMGQIGDECDDLYSQAAGNLTSYVRRDKSGWTEEATGELPDVWQERSMAFWDETPVSADVPVAVEHAWLEERWDAMRKTFPGLSEMPNFESFAIAAKMLTGKVDAHGNPMYVWQDFVAGTDPTDKTSEFKAFISFVDGEPVITWTPDLNEGGTRSLRTYRTLGISDLSQSADPAAWREVAPGNESAYKFFKVEVDMR